MTLARGRPEPQSATGRMEAARRHRARAYHERNELIRVLAKLWPSHVMPISGHLRSLNRKVAVCIHSPAGKIAWILSQDEAAFQFPGIQRISDNHWDHSTRSQRSERIAQIIRGEKPCEKKRSKRAATSLTTASRRSNSRTPPKSETDASLETTSPPLKPL